MRTTSGAILLLCLGASGVVAGGAEAQAERYERYEVSSAPEGLEIHAPTTGTALRVWAVVGAALLAVALGLQLRGGAGVLPVVLAGTGVMALAIGGFAYLDRSVWRVSEVGIVHEGFAGRTRGWRIDEISGVEVSRRNATGAEEKRGIREIWEVGVLGMAPSPGEAGPRVTRLWFRRQEPAEALAARLSEALGKPISGS